jgi:hypothetical protein
MVSATRWRQDRKALATNPYQRIRYYPTYPSGGGGYSAFGWSPIPLDGNVIVGSPAGFTTVGGLSGLGVPLIPSVSGMAKILGAAAGAAAGLWLAKRNLE